MLTEQGYFDYYLNRIGNRPSSEFPHFGRGPDTAEHTLLECPAWKNEREAMEEAIERTTRDDIV